MRFNKILLDLDGTVYIDGRIIADVDIEIRRLSKSGIKFHYMTNNTSVSSRTYYQKLAGLGLPCEADSLISPSLVLSSWITQNYVERVFLLGTEDFCGEVIRNTGIENTANDPECVISAFDKELTYRKLEIACSLINRGIPYYITHIDMACPTEAGPIPDCGAISLLIESVTKIKPAGHFGKPGSFMLEFLSRKIIKNNERIAVAGDRLYTDGLMGEKLGAYTVLVCTGEFKRQDPYESAQVHVYDDLSSFLRLLAG
jgi:HAD superfamily hydrolase (TIGR01450 family)